MNLRNKSRQISLASVFIFFFIPQVQAEFLDDAVNKAKSVTEEVKGTVADVANNDEKSPDSSSKVSAKYADIDIIGLKLGMTQGQVMATLKKHNKGFDIKLHEFKRTSNQRKQAAYLPNHVTVIKARIGRMPPYDSITISFSIPPSNNVVNKIERSVGFAQDTLTDTVVSALKEKYGSPTSERGPLLWDYTKGDKAKCLGVLGYAYMPTDCVELELRSNVDTLKETLSGLRTVLTDHEEIKRQRLATYNYRAQLKEERRQEELKKASQNSAPKL